MTRINQREAQAGAIPVRWQRSSQAETVASDRVSAACYRGSENIYVFAVVVAELKFRDVQRQILAADLVIVANDAALDERPKALNRVRVNRAHNVIFRALANDLMRKGAAQETIAAMLIGIEQTDPVGYRFVHKAIQCRSIGVGDDARHDVAFAAKPRR